MENLTPSALRPLRFAQILAGVNQAQVMLLHVCDPRTPRSKIAWTRSQLELMLSKVTSQTLPVEIQIQPHDNVTQAILNAAKSHDLVVLRSVWRRIGVDGLGIGEAIAPLEQQLTCSVVMLGEPQGTPTSVLTSSKSTRIQKSASI